jgi:hypothetical protein
LTVALLLLSAAGCFVVAGVIVWRKSDDWMALLVSLALLALGPAVIPYFLESSHSPWLLPAILVNILDFVLIFVVFTLFPSGRFVPRWTRWVVVGWVAGSGALAVSYLLTGALRFVAYELVWLTAAGCVAGAQVYRYREVSRPRERAQTRWVVFGWVGTIGIAVVVQTLALLFPALGQPGSLFLLLSPPAYTVALVLLAVCVGMAILRNRLYDIDILIRRTLIYGVVTSTLAIFYFGSVVLLQAGFRAVTGQGSPVALVASTLAIFVLFQPVRGRAQAAIDRRFYRSKRDAAHTLAAFGGTLHSEVDLAALSERLLEVVQDTVQPAQVSLWLAAGPHGGHLSPTQAPGHPAEHDSPTE